MVSSLVGRVVQNILLLPLVEQHRALVDSTNCILFHSETSLFPLALHERLGQAAIPSANHDYTLYLANIDIPPSIVLATFGPMVPLLPFNPIDNFSLADSIGSLSLPTFN